jgi:hypothetical protein
MTTQTQTGTALARASAGGLAAFASGVNPFLARPKEEGVTEGAFLRMNGKTGEYIGSNDTKLDHGTQLAFDLWNSVEAWQGFDSDNKLHRGPEAKFRDGVPLAEPDRSNPKIKWAKVFKIQVRTLDGSPALTYTAKADKPTREIWKLIKRYGEQMGRQVDEAGKYMIPVIEIGARSYEFMAKEKKVVKNPQTGVEEIVEVEQKIKNFSEQFPIVGWVTEAEMDQIVAAAAAQAGEGEEVQVEDEGYAPQAQVAQAPAAPKEIVVEASKPTVENAAAPVTGSLKAGAPAPQPAGPAKRFSTGRVGGRV